MAKSPATRAAAASAATSHLDASPVAELERLEARLESVLCDLRNYRRVQQQAATDRGVLGSRGLTQFIIESLYKAATEDTAITGRDGGFSITALLRLAELAGYAVPTRRILSKRLTERAYRTGDIAWIAGGDEGTGLWYWKGKDAEDVATVEIEARDVANLGGPEK